MGENVKPHQMEALEPKGVYLEEEALPFLHRRLVMWRFPPSPAGCDKDKGTWNAQPLPFSTEEGGVQIDFYRCFEMQLTLSSKDETASKKSYLENTGECATRQAVQGAAGAGEVPRVSQEGPQGDVGGGQAIPPLEGEER